MLIIVFFLICQSIRTIDESNLEMPIFIRIGQMDSSCTNCKSTNILNTECERKYLENTPKNCFQYAFKGEKFQIYGLRNQMNGQLIIFLDEKQISTINLTKYSSRNRIILYTSDIFNYGLHTIRCQSEDEPIEIYEFAYWPSVKASVLI